MKRVQPPALVLDSWSVLAYLAGEPAGQAVADIISQAHENNGKLVMTVANIGEVWYILARQASEKEADEAVEDLDRLGIERVDIDWKLAREAAKFKAKVRMSYADCFAAALAKLRGAPLVTGDEEFKQVGREIRILWPGKR